MDPLDILQQFGVIERLARDLMIVGQEVAETGNKGSVTLTFNIQPAGDGSVMVTDDLKRKPPSAVGHSRLFYAIGDGLLWRDDPRQVTFDIRRGESGDTELRMVDPGQTHVRNASQ